MKYIVLDLETANADYSSICQIGFVKIDDGKIIDEQSILINPDDYFDPWNIAVHGIQPEDVRNAASFNEIYPKLLSDLSGTIVVHHGPFDRIAIQRACKKYQLQNIDAKWLDSQKVVRRTWAEFSQKGYALKKLANHFKLSFTHHDALEDAKTAEIIFRKALLESHTTPDQWLERVEKPVNSEARDITRQGIFDGPHAGEAIVFTGTLSVPRSEAADAAQVAGFNVEDSVNKRTTLLCVGLQDMDRLAGYDKSSKQRKAEEMIAKGCDITIISEADFWALLK